MGKSKLTGKDGPQVSTNINKKVVKIWSINLTVYRNKLNDLKYKNKLPDNLNKMGNYNM